ncbi:hypothetical protein ACS0TY_009285 [Phlomoides rotata]
MDSSIATSSIVTESCLSSEASQPSNPIKLLEVSLISAEDLPSVSKSMQTYAVTWINHNRKRTTQTDPHGHKNPEWTEKFIFRLNKDKMENATLTTEIYTISWFRDVLVGTVCVPLTELIAPLLTNRSMHFVTLQIRRPSGAPQGKLNIGVALLDSTMRSMTMSLNDISQHNFEHYEEDIETKKLKEKIHQWRSMSSGSSNLNHDEQSTAHEGSVICSDIGPSVSVVAAEGVMRLPPPPPLDGDDTASSILEVMTIEEAKARGYTVVEKERWRKGGSSAAAAADSSDVSTTSSRRSARRKSDGGLFSCIAYGIEFTIVCGSSKIPSNRKSGSRRKKTSEINSA